MSTPTPSPEQALIARLRDRRRGWPGICREAADALERLLAERDALAAWTCDRCGCRFASLTPPEYLDGVVHCASCAELLAIGGMVRQREREARTHAFEAGALMHYENGQWRFSGKPMPAVRRALAAYLASLATPGPGQEKPT